MGKSLEQITLKQRVFIIKSFYENRSDLLHVKSDYETFWGVSTAPNDVIIYDVVCLFEDTGSVFYKEAYKCQDPLGEPLKEQIDLKPDVEFLDVNIKNEEPDEEKQTLLKTTCVPIDEDDLPLIEFKEILKIEKVSPIVKKLTKPNKRFPREKPTCVACNKTFQRTNEYQRHLKWHENKCILCGKNTHNLDLHIRRAHIREKNHICPKCGRRFRCNSDLNNHITSHSTERPFVCEICSKSYKCRYDLMKHSYVHKPESEKKKFQCPKCPKIFALRSYLTKHMRYHNEVRKYMCDVCGKSFVTKNYLRKHMMIHTGEKPHECQICKKAFTTKPSLNIHLRIHTGERPFKCNFCPKTFYDASTRKVHQRNHTGEEPYKCPICGKTCKQGQNLRSHMRHIHYKNADPNVKISIKKV